MAKQWTKSEFETLMSGKNSPGRSAGACEAVREAVKDYLKGGRYGNSALSGWMKFFLDVIFKQKNKGCVPNYSLIIRDIKVENSFIEGGIRYE